MEKEILQKRNMKNVSKKKELLNLVNFSLASLNVFLFSEATILNRIPHRIICRGKGFLGTKIFKGIKMLKSIKIYKKNSNFNITYKFIMFFYKCCMSAYKLIKAI